MNNKSYKVIVINPTPNTNYDNITKTQELETFLNKGWRIERETVIPCSVSAPAYRGLSSVIYILSIDKI